MRREILVFGSENSSLVYKIHAVSVFAEYAIDRGRDQKTFVHCIVTIYFNNK